ncbi:hypothetical protein DSL72_006766 [Monilinia vaccinii-corymbosi]|uniref:Uncharacterized protein n=1 Tax=Monilinia vaccinii-corymbosi TaxID=61207 RepID=A0A8A3PPE2_9HELO|nr:hypothetical protein DSL72_006766 [Monilinia vaccinii-corymbosi]
MHITITITDAAPRLQDTSSIVINNNDAFPGSFYNQDLGTLQIQASNPETLNAQTNENIAGSVDTPQTISPLETSPGDFQSAGAMWGGNHPRTLPVPNLLRSCASSRNGNHESPWKQVPNPTTMAEPIDIPPLEAPPPHSPQHALGNLSPPNMLGSLNKSNGSNDIEAMGDRSGTPARVALAKPSDFNLDNWVSWIGSRLGNGGTFNVPSTPTYTIPFHTPQYGTPAAEPAIHASCAPQDGTATRPWGLPDASTPRAAGLGAQSPRYTEYGTLARPWEL